MNISYSDILTHVHVHVNCELVIQISCLKKFYVKLDTMMWGSMNRELH